MSSPPIKNVAIAGSSGALGSHILRKFLDSGAFNVRILARAGSAPSNPPPGAEVVEADFASVESLAAAFRGQDLVVSAVGTSGLAGQAAMVEAAAAAGVRRFVPSEFGSDLDVPGVRALPVFAPKVAIQDLLVAKSASTSLTYTFVYSLAFLDWGLEQNFLLDLSGGKPALIDGGDVEFSATTLAGVADAVVGVASRPDETRNRSVRVHQAVVTQNRLLSLARRALPGLDPSPSPVPVALDDLTDRADRRLAQGLYDMETFAPYLFRAIMDPRSRPRFDAPDNELLGVKGVTDDDIIDIFKSIHPERVKE